MKIIRIRKEIDRSDLCPDSMPPGGYCEVYGTLEDGTEHRLFGYYTDELSFSEENLVGLSLDDARQLRFIADVAFLQS